MANIKKIIVPVNGQKAEIDFTKIDSDIQNVNSKIDSDIQNVNSKIDSDIQNVNSKIDSEIKNVDTKLSKLKYDIKNGSKSFRSALIFYSYPTDLNELYEVDLVVPVIGKYDLAVFGRELCEPDSEARPDTIKIISQLNESYGTEVFGYVPIGCLTPEEDPEIDVSNLTIDQIKTRILSWKEMGAKGIFLDEYGYDYRVTRERQNEVVDFCHENSLPVIANAWVTDHVFGTENYIVEAGNTKKHPGNPNNLECHLTEDDYVFFEHLMFYATSNTKVKAEVPWDVYRVQEYYEKYYKKFKTQVFIANQVPTNASADVQKELIRCSQIAGAVMQADVLSVAGEFWSSESSKTFYVEPFEIDGIKSRFIDVSYKGNEDTGYPIKFKSVIGSREYELVWNAKGEEDTVYSSDKNYAQVNSNRDFPLNVSADKLIYQDYDITATHNFKNGINLNGSKLIGTPDGALKFQDKNIVRSVNNVPADENGNVMINAGGSTTGGSKELGEIFYSTTPMTNVNYHLLDGTILDGNAEEYKQFYNYLLSIKPTYASLFIAEEDYQTQLNDKGVCGKYVLDEVNKTIRLPKITGFVEGTVDSSALGELVEAGLPNITGVSSGNQDQSGALSGAFYLIQAHLKNSGGEYYGSREGFDASRCSPIYGNSSTVQPQSIKLFVYVVVNNGSVEDAPLDVTKEYQLNNPFSLFDYRYVSHRLNNASWVLSTNTFLSADLYSSAYEKLLAELNESSIGLSVKRASDVYTDYDYVVDTENNSFRLPLTIKERVLVESKVATDEDPTWYNLYSDGWIEQGGSGSSGKITLLKAFANTNYIVTTRMLYGGGSISWDEYGGSTNKTTATFNVGRTPVSWYACGYAQDKPTTNLYFYLGDTVSNPSLIELGFVQDRIGRVERKIGNISKVCGMPDYASEVILTNEDTAPKDGVVIIKFEATNAFLVNVGEFSDKYDFYGNRQRTQYTFIVSKGDKISLSQQTGSLVIIDIKFYPFKTE